jgi:hypothetical protein
MNDQNKGKVSREDAGREATENIANPEDGFFVECHICHTKIANLSQGEGWREVAVNADGSTDYYCPRCFAKFFPEKRDLSGTYEVGVKVPYGKAGLYVKTSEEEDPAENEAQAESLREELFEEALETLAKRLGVPDFEGYDAQISDSDDALSTVNITLSMETGNIAKGFEIEIREGKLQFDKALENMDWDKEAFEAALTRFANIQAAPSKMSFGSSITNGKENAKSEA